ncbi:uncharacterized protein Z519_01430 [Cladophialophora bantiana CBS 173.52]|uniref:Uncharacterized protein n=1 Tax=Cladophialophora bantiana (strain ATCC 10958 / CBS 173.52 / CDC B-1940 / NIH 8579) TaxID=1442370 RepID=A0A0D2F6S1_CLAB1|nr:uncharacterized protein Z519_01430 [Cladophialophora bantiana CBS 173.52]KIW97846.1 hypothetical protein Z519_01430 [Cladophialophora bantiana CBS 173.52]
MILVTYFLFVPFLPIPIVILAITISRKTRTERLGSARLSFSALTTYKNTPSKDNEAWLDRKWCFYLFNFTLETIDIYLYVLLRVDRRFHISNGTSGPGDYRAGQSPWEKPQESGDIGAGCRRVNSEEEMFNDHRPTGPHQHCITPKTVVFQGYFTAVYKSYNSNDIHVTRTMNPGDDGTFWDLFHLDGQTTDKADLDCSVLNKKLFIAYKDNSSAPNCGWQRALTGKPGAHGRFTMNMLMASH